MKVRKIKYQFFLLSGVIALILAVVSCVGFYTSYRGLDDSIGDELSAVVGEQSLRLDGWMQQKAGPAIGASILLGNLGTRGSTDINVFQSVLRMASDDKDILGLIYGTAQGNVYTSAGDRTGSYDPRTRPWYQLAQQTGHLAFTEVYKDVTSDQPVVSAVAPVKTANGTFIGAVCDDISLKSLDEVVGKLKWHNVGEGIIIAPNGMVVSSTVQELLDKSINDSTLAPHFEEMKANKHGYFSLPGSMRGDMLVAYQTMDTTGWIIAIGVPTREIYAPLARLRFVYVILTCLGVALTLFLSWRLSADITERIERLGLLADTMAKGNLKVVDAEDNSLDELGNLSRSFNQMKDHLRQLVQHIIQASGRIASSAEELTATTQQSAEASASSAQSVTNVAHGVTRQTENMRQASDNVRGIYNDIQGFAETSTQIAKRSEEAKAAAKQGSTLMANALHSMDAIDQSTQSTAEVVARLGKSQGQISEIVDTISSIANQTNLLALNAAIEAARAGEQGRGFAVVADEVRKLAGESSKSAEEIRDRIAQIQADTQAAITAMQAGKDSVAQGTGAIRDVDAQFTGILQKVADIHDQIEASTQNAQVLSSTAKNVYSSIEDVGHIAQETAGHAQSISASTEEQNASTEEIAAAAKELAKMAEDLQGTTSRFQV